MLTPTLLAIYDKDFESIHLLLERIKPILPLKFYAHLSPNLIDVFGKQNIIESYGAHYKMALKKSPLKITDESIKRLTVADIQIINTFYTNAYPDNWFDPRMLETQKYFGYFSEVNLLEVRKYMFTQKSIKWLLLGILLPIPIIKTNRLAAN